MEGRRVSERRKRILIEVEGPATMVDSWSESALETLYRGLWLGCECEEAFFDPICGQVVSVRKAEKEGE